MIDATLMAALAGVAGAILGSVLGGIFALKAAKRQVEVMLRQSRGDVNERLYNQSLSIMKFFAENPELRPYFYDNKEIERAANDLEKLKVLSTAEMVAGFMDLVALQLEDQPDQIRPRRKAYLVDQHKSSAVLREHIAECAAWYADDFLGLLPMESLKASPPKTLDKPEA